MKTEKLELKNTVTDVKVLPASGSLSHKEIQLKLSREKCDLFEQLKQKSEPILCLDKELAIESLKESIKLGSIQQGWLPTAQGSQDTFFELLYNVLAIQYREPNKLFNKHQLTTALVMYRRQEFGNVVNIQLILNAIDDYLKQALESKTILIRLEAGM